MSTAATASKLRPAYVAVIERRVMDPKDRRSKASATRSYVTATGGESMDCTNAYASRDRGVIVAMIKGVEGGRVLEWMLSDGRING